MLYDKELNAIYGIMRAAILFYNKFVECLTTIGFKLTPCEPCATKIQWQENDCGVACLLSTYYPL